MKLANLLASAPATFIKDADVESPDEVQLEQDFASLSFLFLRDKASALMPYLLGFEVVDREEDGSRAVGIFGFKISGKYYYVPSFFINNQVKGLDLLFCKATNSFVPLKESWINHILNRSSLRLGDGVENSDDLAKDFENPSFDFVSDPPNTTKTSEDAKEALKSAMSGIQAGTADMLAEDEETKQALAGALSSLSGDNVDEWVSETGSLRQFLTKSAGINGFEAFLKLFEDRKYAEAAMKFYGSISSFDVPVKTAEKAEKKLTIISKEEVYSSPSDNDLPDSEKSRIVRDGFAVIDNRSDDEKSEVFDIDYVKQYSNPSCPGEYEVLLRNGSSVAAYVFEPCKCNGNLVVVSKDGFSMFSAKQEAIFVRGDKLGDDVKGLVPLESMKPGYKYILVGEGLKASDVIRIQAEINAPGERKRFNIRSYMPYDSQVGRLEYISLADDEGKSLRHAGHTLVVPSTFKALEIKDDKTYEVNAEFRPGSLSDLDYALSKQAVHRLSVDTDGVEFHIYLDNQAEGPYGTKTAAITLLAKYAMDIADVEGILGEASTAYKSRKLVKFAQGVSVGMGVPALADDGGYDEDTGQPILNPVEEEVTGDLQGVPPLADTTDPNYAVGGELEQSAASELSELANQAAASGQKNVFDHATIGSLAGLYDASSAIDQYVPGLLQALDRVGRILFIFYWKNEEFADRYGNEDMAELEDLIRSVFKSYGDLVLKLKQKSPGMDAAKDILTV
jgi:hypothetical protein